MKTGMIVCFISITVLVLGAEEPTRVTVNAKPFIDHLLPDCGIQQAIDKAAETGGTVIIPAGEYKLRRGLVLKSNVVLKGEGQDKTMLMPFRKVQRLEFTKPGPDKEGWVDVDRIPGTMNVGSAVVIWRMFPAGHSGHQRPAWVEAVDRQNRRLKLNIVWGYLGHGHKHNLTPGKNLLTYGLALSLDRDVKKGDTDIVLKDASLLKAGDEIAVGEPTNDSRDRQRFIKEVKGNTVVLDRPITHPLDAWKGKAWMSVTRIPFALHPAIHGWDVANAQIRELTIQGYADKHIYPSETRYTLSGIHLFNSRKVLIENVTIRDWPADGFSLQTADNVKVRNCRAENVLGNGFHPGTGFKNGSFEGCVAVGCGTGFYWCWHNQNNLVNNCKFINNRGGGMTGLGNPSDLNNTIESNLFAGNGASGIAINGGRKSGNTIRNNVIENNSKSEPGKYPAIAVYASTENAQDYTITGNTVRDTQEQPTQWIGIEERNGKRKGKATSADHNTITGNTYSGHRTADIVQAGKNTRIEEASSVRIVNADVISTEKR